MKPLALALCVQVLLTGTVNAGVRFTDYQADSPSIGDRIFTTSGKESGYTKLPAYDLISGLIPNGWVVNLGPGASNARLEWQPSPNWQSAIMKIQELNQGIYIAINNQAKVVGVATKREHLEYLQTREPKIWTIDPKLTLRENFEEMDKKSNIKIVYDAGDIEYPVLTRAIFVGNLEGRNGVVDRILQSTKQMKWPLAVNYLPEIPALHIVLGGAKHK